MSDGEASASVPGRSLDQRLVALQHANEVRSARAKLKKDLAAGKIQLAQILVQPPWYVRTARVRDILLVLPNRLGQGRPDPDPMRDRSLEDIGRLDRSPASGTAQPFRSLICRSRLIAKQTPNELALRPTTAAESHQASRFRLVRWLLPRRTLREVRRPDSGLQTPSH